MATSSGPPRTRGVDGVNEIKYSENVVDLCLQCQHCGGSRSMATS